MYWQRILAQAAVPIAFDLAFAMPVFGCPVALRLEPPPDRVSRLHHAVDYLAVGKLVAQLLAPSLAYHLNSDQLLVFSLKLSAEKLKTLVNFESARLRLRGHFSVGVNRFASWIKIH